MKLFGKTVLKLMGWNRLITVKEPPKSVICCAPHTSNIEFIIGQLFYWAEGRKASFLIKKSWFVFPIGGFMRMIGGVPVDRSRANSVTSQMAAEFEKREYFHLVVTPEGTRKLNKRWKMGFYYIAKMANVPIQLAYLDFEKKEIAITELFIPSDDEAADFAYIQNYYKGRVAKYPERFNLSAMYLNAEK